jgi:Zn-dependent M28 family amino/carboxypeptidase
MSQPNPFLSQDQLIEGDVYTSAEPMDNLITLCDDFGSRFGGTEGERQAADLFQVKMKAYGLQNVHAEPFEYAGWTRGQVHLEITSPIQRTIPCISLPLSPPARLEGTLVDMEDGAPEDFDRKADEIRGRIVMTTSVVRPKGAKRWIHRSEKYGRSLMAGATGFIFVNHYPGFGPATGGVGHDDEGPIPGISLSYEDGAFIRRLMQRRGPVTVRLTSTDHSERMTSWNIVGDLVGKQHPEQIVMLGSHYDGHDISQGAGDPASGAVAVLEAARVLARHMPDLPRTVRFCLWGVEETGLFGSRAYVAAHAGELSNIRFYLNMDAAGAATNVRDIVLNEWPELEAVIRRWRDEMADDFAVGQSVLAYSDHYPFFLEGVPTGGMQSVQESLTGRGYGHTRYDTVDKVELDDLREASALAARLALRLASEEAWPVSRRETEAVKALLDSPEYREEEAYRQRLEAFLQEAHKQS